MATETLNTPTTTTTEPPLTSPPLPDTDQGEKRKQPEPDSSTNPLHKTSLCSYFRSTGNACSHGDTCRYAHGEEELRMRPDNTWDPTSDKAKKMKVENGEVENVEVREEECDENGLDKCLLNLPLKWGADQFKAFLDAE
ncbi:zinc finger CCCH domain-containing protein 24, partial [Tanacetum coccineum]